MFLLFKKSLGTYKLSLQCMIKSILSINLETMKICEQFEFIIRFLEQVYVLFKTNNFSSKFEQFRSETDFYNTDINFNELES